MTFTSTVGSADGELGGSKGIRYNYANVVRMTIAFVIGFQVFFTILAWSRPDWAGELTFQMYLAIGSTNILALWFVLVGFKAMEKSQPVVDKFVTLGSQVMKALQEPRPCEHCCGKGEFRILDLVADCPDCDGKGEVCYTEEEIEAKVNEIVASIPKLMAMARDSEKWWQEHKSQVEQFVDTLAKVDLAKLAKVIEKFSPELDKLAQAPPPPDDFDHSIYAPVKKDEEPRINTPMLPDWASMGCPVCNAKAGEWHCIAMHAAQEDVARGGNGVVGISCPCPRCSPRC